MKTMKDVMLSISGRVPLLDKFVLGVLGLGDKQDFRYSKKRLKKISDEKIVAGGVFSGGPDKYFEEVGRLQLISLLKIGLYPDSKVLDVGCGCLRGGYWLIHFLNSGNYFGIEPDEHMVKIGLKYLIPKDVAAQKSPSVNYNDRFDFSVFNEKFDYVIARSIWTHASKSQIESMLDSFLENSREDAVFLTSHLRGYPDYKGSEWVGFSHESKTAGCISHRMSWLKKQCEIRGLSIEELQFDVFNRQRWLYIRRHQ